MRVHEVTVSKVWASCVCIIIMLYYSEGESDDTLQSEMETNESEIQVHDSIIE